MTGARLGLNVDHIATVRQARGEQDPDPVAAVIIGEMAGAHGIVIHLRGDRRHIQDRDVELISKVVKGTLNIEMSATEEMLSVAERIKPHLITLVPERPGEVTTEGGLDAISNRKALASATERLVDAGIEVSLFIDPVDEQIRAAGDIGARIIEINTDTYSKSPSGEQEEISFKMVADSASFISSLGLTVVAGHGLNYRNAGRIARIPEVVELNIGHNIIARSTLVGLEKAVREMLALIT